MLFLSGFQKRILAAAVALAVLAALVTVLFTFFFDQAVFMRKGTVFRVPADKKLVALTFDDGPSPGWTPQILDALKKVNARATFFMLGEHAQKYPDVVRRVAAEGHEIGNHGFSHSVLLYYKKEEIESEISRTEKIIKDIVGVTTTLFRPPKALLTKGERKFVKSLGYEVVLWSLNSKDWVTFDDKYIVRYLAKNVRPGDIILFHDSGGALKAEGGDRHETVLTIPRLVEKLRERGYEFVTVSELMNGGK